MSCPVISCIVEGHGERDAVGVLVRRVAAQLDPGLVPKVPPPLRVPKDRLLRSGELKRSIDLAARHVKGSGGVFILIDADDDAPCVHGPQLLARANQARPDVPIAVVLAKREFEAWFLAAAESLRGQRGLPSDLEPPTDPEGVRGAKEWLRSRMRENRTYSEPLDQPALAATFDLNVARLRSGSFDKCWRELTRLLRSP